MRLASCLFLAFLAPSAAPVLRAQTFIVDQHNGAGTHFTSLATAIAAVPDGAVLIVRAGFYLESFVIQGKGLTVLGEPGALVSLPFQGGEARITGLAAHQSVCVRDLTIGVNNNNPTPRSLSCAASQGLIVIENTPATPTLLNLDVRDCAQVVVRDCNLRTTLAVENVHLERSNVVFERCLLGSGLIAMTQLDGAVQLIDTAVTGGTLFLGPVPHAIATYQGALRVLGNSTVIGGQNLSAGPGYAITGTSAVRLDPSVILGGANPPLDPALPVVVAPMPRALTAYLVPSQIRAELLGPTGQLGVLLCGAPGAPTPVPGCLDSFWLAGSPLFLVAAGTLSPLVPLVHTLPMSGSPALLGVRLGWQGASYDPATGFALSNPSFQVVR